MAGLWVITRARHDALPLVEALQSSGCHALAVPCIERAPTCWARPVFTGRKTLAFLTSGSAAEAVLPCLTEAPADHLASLSPSTSHLLWRAGLRVDVESTRGAVELAQAVVSTFRSDQPLHVWYPTGQLKSAEQTSATTCLQQIGIVTNTIVYETRAPVGLADALRTLPEPFSIFFASPSAVTHFVQATQRQPQVVACWGQSTYQAAFRHFASSILVDRSRPLIESLHHLGQPHD